MLREWVVEGGGLDGYFGEQGLPAGIQECLERFHRRCVKCKHTHVVVRAPNKREPGTTYFVTFNKYVIYMQLKSLN